MTNEEHSLLEAQILIQKVSDEAYYKGYCMGATLYYDFMYPGPGSTVGHYHSTSPRNAYIQFLNLFSRTYMPKTYHQKGLFDE